MTDEAGRAETRADAALPGAGETGRQAAKAARRAEKAARKAGQRKAEKAAHKAEKAARKAERSARRAQGAGDSDAAGQSASMVGRPVRPTRQEREVAAEAVLAQVADLVRRGGDPAVGPSEASAGAPPTGPTSAALPVPLVWTTTG
jgi:hypothetical protein